METIEILLDPNVGRRPSAVTLRKLPLFEDLDFVNIPNLEPPWIPEPDVQTNCSLTGNNILLSSSGIHSEPEFLEYESLDSNHIAGNSIGDIDGILSAY